MRLERIVLPVVLASTVAIYAGCGSAPVKEQPVISLSAAQVEQMSDYPALLELYRNAAANLKGKDPAKFASDFASLNEVGKKLAALRLSELTEQFNAARLASGLVPHSVLKPAKDEVANPPVDTALWQPVTALVQDEVKKNDEAVKALSAKLDKADIDDATRLVTMDDLYRLTGDQSWLDKRNAFVDTLIEDIRQARAAGAIDAKVQNKIDLVLENRGDDPTLKQELVELSAEIYQLDYFKALADGKADKAFKIFVKMSESKNFADIKKSLSGVSQKMVDYFVAEADESVKNKANLAQSYRWYDQARVVSSRLGLKKQKIAGHEALVKQLDERYADLSKQGAHTIALAYLHAIEEFAPLHKGLRQKFAETEEKVRGQAIRRLSTTAFDGDKAKGYGDIISSKVTQHLFKHVPNDVRIVEREQYEALQRERQLGGKGDGLTAVDLLVTGSVLEAQVEEEKQQGKKTVRAVVGKETITNQAYIKWLELSAKDRKNIEKPSETMSIDKEENIPINETRHRKVGIFSVSYRLVDAENGRVLFPDSYSEREEYTGVSQEGVELGDFKREFILADLPSDVSILDSLANKVSETIGSRLVERLKDQEKKYLEQAEIYKKDDSCAQQADALAKALVIMESKGIDTKTVFEEYKTTAISCEAI